MVACVKLSKFAIMQMLASALAMPSFASTAVTFNMDGVQSDKGYIRFALYQADAEHSWHDEPVHVAEIDASQVKNQQLTHTVPKLPAGNYAVRLFHDENANQRLDVGPNGIPLESFAFSGEGLFTGVPNVEQAAFSVSTNALVVQLTLRHPQQSVPQAKP